MLNSLVSAFVYSPYVDERGLLVCTKIIRLPRHPWSLEPWDCYFFEITADRLQSGRDISFRIRRSASHWSLHHFRPFFLERDSAARIAGLVSASSKVARWRTFHAAGSVAFSALVFYQDQPPSEQNSISIYTHVPAPRYRLDPFLAFVGPPSPALDPPCSVYHCLMCARCANMDPFEDGSFLTSRFSSAAVTHTLTTSFAVDFMFPAVERSYSGDVFAHSRTLDVFYLLVRPEFSVAEYGSVAVTDRALYMHFAPIPEPHPNSDLYVYFQEARLAATGFDWIGFGPHVDFQILRRRTPPHLLHFARNLVLSVFVRDGPPPSSLFSSSPGGSPSGTPPSSPVPGEHELGSDSVRGDVFNESDKEVWAMARSQ